jgi:hypothetical protein
MVLWRRHGFLQRLVSSLVVAGAAGAVISSHGAADAAGAHTAGLSAVVAADEDAVAALYNDCSAYATLPDCGGLFKVSKTSDGKGGTLFGILLTRTVGGGCSDGSAYFFDGEQMLATTAQSQNAPATVTRLRPVSKFGTWASAISTPRKHEFEVRFLLFPSLALSTCPEAGKGGHDSYVYRWTGSTFKIISGHPPKPPVIF